MPKSPARFAAILVAVVVVGCSDGASSPPPWPVTSAGAAGNAASATGAGGASAGAAGATPTPENGGVAGTTAGDAAAGSSSTGDASAAADAKSESTGDAGVSAVASGPSAGCGKPVSDSPTAWTARDITVTVDAKFAPAYGTRRYFTRPPKTYDPSKAYPVTFWGQGCGQSTAEPTPLSLGPAADGSIQIQLLSKTGCFSAGPDGDNASSPELPYFDAVLAEVEDAFCIDRGKVFMGGYSSGGWLTGLLACTRTNVIRGVGFAAAGLQLNHAPCEGPVAAIMTRGASDPGTPLAQTLAAKDSILLRNGCSMDTVPWDPGETTFTSSSCLSYQGCKPGYPVVWCPTPGGHSNGLDSGLSSKGFWKLWASLP